MRCVEFRVYGVPQVKGSTRAFVRRGHAIVTADNPSLAKWESAVRFSAETIVMRAGAQLFEGAVGVVITFYLPRPQSVSARRRPFPTTRPDLDKAIRAILDPLTGVVYRDDAQVVTLQGHKCYTVGPAYAKVRVFEIPARALDRLSRKWGAPGDSTGPAVSAGRQDRDGAVSAGEPTDPAAVSRAGSSGRRTARADGATTKRHNAPPRGRASSTSR